MAVAAINEAIDSQDPAETLKALQMPAAGMREVEEPNAVLYQRLLQAEKEKKGQVSGRCGKVCLQKELLKTLTTNIHYNNIRLQMAWQFEAQQYNWQAPLSEQWKSIVILCKVLYINFFIHSSRAQWLCKRRLLWISRSVCAI